MRYLGASSSVAGAGVLVAAAYGDSTPSVAIESEIPVAARKESTPPAAPIALGLQAGRDWAIVLAQPDGSQTRTVVGGFRLSPEPALSPDASSVVFSSRTGGRSSVQTIKADGTGRRRLSPPGIDAYSPSWSPDGRRIVFEGVDPISGLTSIDVVDVDGSGFSRLTDYGRDEAPDWAPDGRKIVFAARDDIYSMNADGTGRTAVTHFSRLPLGGRPRALSPRWSPDGRWILFTKLLQHPSGDDGEFTIALIRPDGTGEHQIRTTGGAPLAPRWTPDGTRIVFQICCTKGRVDAGTVPSDGGATSFIARGEPAAVQQEKAAAGSNPDAGASAAVKAATRLPAGARAMSAALTGPSITFTRNDLDLRPFGQATEGNNVADIDGDGKLDIVVAGDNAIVWYHNPDWTPHLIATGRYGAGAMVLPLDVNGDGLIDIVTGSQNNPSCTEYCRTLWLENTGSDWVEHTIAETAYCHDLAVGDLNGDGRPDLACDNQISRRILWMEAPADPTQPWPVTMIDDRDAMGIDVADMDGDGRLDVVAGRAWYRNETSGGWTRYAFTTLAQTCCSTVFDDFEKVNVKDVNGDGRPDVLATLFTDTPLGQVWAFLAPADPYGGGWTSVQIDAGPRFSVHGQAVASFDGTSAVQFAVGETNYGGWSFGANPSPELNVYRLDGAADQPSSWEKIMVDRQGAHELRAADLDGDGLPDLTGDFENTDRLNPPTDGALHWWINTTTAAPAGRHRTWPCRRLRERRARAMLLEASTGTWTGESRRRSPTSGWTATRGAPSAPRSPAQRRRRTSSRGRCGRHGSRAGDGDECGGAGGGDLGGDRCDRDRGGRRCPARFRLRGHGRRLHRLHGDDPRGGSFRAAVAGGNADNDSAYAQLDFGGNTGLLGKTYVRTVVQLENGKSPSGNLAILQERDVSGNLIYELYIAPDRTLRIYSPPGGVSELGENSTTGVVVPNDGATALRVEVAALANSSMVVRVNGVDKLTFDPLARATTGNPRFLRVGIDHYGAPATNDPISVVHASVAVTQAGWLGAPPQSPPANTAPPTIVGPTSLGQVLTAANGTWSNGPTGFVYQWQRCNSGGANCAAIGGATDPTYMLVSGDVGNTIRVVVTATNEVGSGSATSVQTAVVLAAPTTLGKTAVGALTHALGGGYLEVSGRYTQDSAQPVSLLSAYLQGGGSVTGMRAVIYADSGNRPGAFVAVSQPVTIAAGQSAGWVDFPLSGSPTLPAGEYWLGLWASNTSALGFYDGVSGSGVYAPAGYSVGGNPPANWPGGGGNDTLSYSLYATVGPTGTSAPANTALPAITGAATEGQVLSASTGGWTGSPTGYAYQWQRCDSAGANCSAVGAATNQTYTLVAADIANTIRVEVTATNASGSTPATSNQTALVQAAASAPANTALPTIAGSALVGATLTADDGSWNASPAPTFATSGGAATTPGRTASTSPAQPTPRTPRLLLTSTTRSGRS